jgi:hypothetical protein
VELHILPRVVTTWEEFVETHPIREDRTGRDTRYKVIGGGNDWKLVEEIGVDARTEMRAKGICAFVSNRVIPDALKTPTNPGLGRPFGRGHRAKFRPIRECNSIGLPRVLVKCGIWPIRTVAIGVLSWAGQIALPESWINPSRQGRK